ncbi:MAG: hypothetical protein KDC54_07455, partial [Lewinella sp.]|nr:hypothetical protein [Lewinella sp.]
MSTFFLPKGRWVGPFFLLLLGWFHALPGQPYYSHTSEGLVHYEPSVERILLRLDEAMPEAQRAELFRRFAALPDYDPRMQLDTPRILIPRLRPGTDQAAVSTLLDELRQAPGVRLCHPFLVYGDGTQ